MFYSLTAMCSAFHRYCNTPMSQCVVHFMCSGTLKCLIQHSSEQVHCNVYSLTAMCSAFHRYCNTPHEPVCVVHFMCSETLKCLIQHSSEQVYCNVLFTNCYV